MRKWCLPLTYQPKIEGVKDGTITQTIRKGNKFHAGDMVMFHGWAGRPYYSAWNWRTEYFTLLEIITAQFNNEGISHQVYEILQTTRSVIPVNPRLVGWQYLDGLAIMDGIIPPTGLALKEILKKKNGKIEGTYQIIRWMGRCNKYIKDLDKSIYTPSQAERKTGKSRGGVVYPELCDTAAKTGAV
jgi:hypothetical protein